MIVLAKSRLYWGSTSSPTEQEGANTASDLRSTNFGKDDSMSSLLVAAAKGLYDTKPALNIITSHIVKS